MSSVIPTLIRYIPRMWKAVYAGVAAGAFAYGALQVDGMTAGEWGYLAASVLVAGVGAWKVKNALATAPGNPLAPSDPGT